MGVVHMMFQEEAAKCRREAEAFTGTPEGSFLLAIASTFEKLAADERQPHSNSCKDGLAVPSASPR
jgi:hypothetical protein